MKKSKEELVVEYLNSDFNTEDDSDKYLDAMLAISSTSAGLGSEVTSLLTALSSMQKSRLSSIQKEFKDGLSDDEKPFGSTVSSVLTSDTLHYTPKDTTTKNIETFLIKLSEVLQTNNEKEKNKLVRELKKEVDIFKESNINLKNYITTRSEKSVWNMLVFNDPSKMDRQELEDLLLQMQLAITKHAKTLKERKDYFSSLNKIEKGFIDATVAHLDSNIYFKVISKYNSDKSILKTPNTKELVKDVSKIKVSIENRLEKLPEYLDESQKEIMKEFLPLLSEYYEDQSAAFINGKSYLPLAKDLEEFHNSIETHTVASFLNSSNKLGFTMQHLYLLHWVGEELMKKFNKKDLTLGRNINKRKQIIKAKNKNYTNYTDFMNGVIFRNNVAHNGIIWEPQGFEEAIVEYKKGILLLGKDFKINLESESMPKRQIAKISDKDEFAKKNFNLAYDEVQELLRGYNTHFEKVGESVIKEDDSMKPASSTLFYLSSIFNKELTLDMKTKQGRDRDISTIKKIIESSHER